MLQTESSHLPYEQGHPATETAVHFKGLDTLGASLSFACAIHCAMQPVLLAILPLMGLGFLMNEQLESLFLACSILLASITVISGWRHHRQTQALPLLVLAAGLIILSRIPAFEAHEAPLAIFGALGIMSSHLLNLWLHRQAHPHHHSQALTSELSDSVQPSTQLVA